MALMSLLPLKCTVQNASAGLETPQRVTEQVVHAYGSVMALTGESREADGSVLVLAFACFLSGSLTLMDTTFTPPNCLAPDLPRIFCRL